MGKLNSIYPQRSSLCVGQFASLQQHSDDSDARADHLHCTSSSSHASDIMHNAECKTVLVSLYTNSGSSTPNDPIQLHQILVYFTPNKAPRDAELEPEPAHFARSRSRSRHISPGAGAVKRVGSDSERGARL